MALPRRNSVLSSAGPKELRNLDEITSYLPPGSSVVLHSAYAEPRFLAQELARVGTGLRDVRVYTLMPAGGSPYAAPELDRHLAIRTFLPGKALRKAVDAGRAEVLRVPLSAIPGMFTNKLITADLLLLQLSPPDQHGLMSMGVSVDYMPAVLSQRPTVIAEVNPAMPHTCGDSCIHIDQVDYVVEARTPPQFLESAVADEVDRQIAGHVSELIGRGDVLQLGVGAIADLVLGHLGHLSNLGIHSGIITDAVVPLIERGIVTNATKRTFVGKSIATMAAGTQAFYDFLHRNALVEFHPCALTHDAGTLAAINQLCAINTVLQIDLEGRANAEVMDGRTISCVGGSPDFAKGATVAEGGKSVVVLRSSSRDGQRSNILSQLPAGVPVTLDGSVIDFVVTEYGVARIRGLSSSSCANALIDIAHPAHRLDLRRNLRQ